MGNFVVTMVETTNGGAKILASDVELGAGLRTVHQFSKGSTLSMKFLRNVLSLLVYQSSFQ